MEIDFITNHHKKTKRNYLERVNKINKAEAAIKAKKWDFDYWDGSRDVNYGGYHYDGRWEPIAKKMIEHYNLKPTQNVKQLTKALKVLFFTAFTYYRVIYLSFMSYHLTKMSIAMPVQLGVYSICAINMMWYKKLLKMAAAPQ